MSGSPTETWLEARLRTAPDELSRDIRRLVAETPPSDLQDPVRGLARAALTGLEQVADGTGARQEALRLLAADAALTYAFEAAAESGRSEELAEWVGLRGELGRRLAGATGTGSMERPEGS
jgi:hypothetical protein